MADSQKKQALDTLATVLDGVSGVNTVVIANSPIDMDLYTESQLWLAQVIPANESVEYETAFVAMFDCSVEVTVFFLAEDPDYEDRQSVRKAVADALGADPTLSGTCADCGIQSIVSGGTFPLFEEVFNLIISFERHRANA